MPGGEGLVRFVSTITMSPCSSVGAIESPLIVISRNPFAAADEALDSRWVAQTGRRAHDIARLLRGA